jgi:hypothetical protein
MALATSYVSRQYDVARARRKAQAACRRGEGFSGGHQLHTPRAQRRIRTQVRARWLGWGVWNVRLCRTFHTPHPKGLSWGHLRVGEGTWFPHPPVGGGYVYFSATPKNIHTPPEWGGMHLHASYPLHTQYVEQVNSVEPEGGRGDAVPSRSPLDDPP